jgi:hypothetical protein
MSDTNCTDEMPDAWTEDRIAEFAKRNRLDEALVADRAGLQDHLTARMAEGDVSSREVIELLCERYEIPTDAVVEYAQEVLEMDLYEPAMEELEVACCEAADITLVMDFLKDYAVV